MGLTPKRAVLGACATAAGAYLASRGAIQWRRHQRARPVVAFATGGAGSHVFPAIAVATDLQQQGVGAVFLTDSRGLEVNVVPQYGFVLYCISSVELQRPLKSVTNALSVLRFPFCVLHSAGVLIREAPDALVSTGGSVSVPACVAAAALGIPLLLYEPNAIAGAVTQALHGISCRTLLAYDSAAAGLRHKERCVVVGPAVRKEILGAAPTGTQGGTEDDRRRQQRRRAAREALGVTGRGSRLLVVLGGSRGCGYLNCAVNNVLPQLAAVPGLHVLWQTGARQYVAYSVGHAASLPSVRCTPFISDMGSALAAADLVVGRAGAATVAELGAAGTPALLVPSPAVSEEQQAANARVLADGGFAEVVPQLDVDEVGLAPFLLHLLRGPEGSQRLATMRTRWRQRALAYPSLSSFPSGGPRDSVDRLRNEILAHVRRG